ncbi:cysteine--tRNA ligase [Fusobacterium necrophorum]|uniref:cysteine--tRNA ligase n=1 Tax=Fusobacterium necrophorum TaxID=859 RepID=UPI000C1B4736|nr:cysteine--tRNA ligase [Fusobacterium necrophorum]PIM86619.1 cysteine--tRNA ligase [Fusobacterium necrophorum subsp. funduliforme]PIM92631.1 cysteine--tRNA ligase [Fusobacterium necrophorum subsp. funduliforme]
MIKIYNTLSAALDTFVPRKEKEVSMYVCGPTVYNYIHIGNARPAIVFDTVRRYFEYRGYQVKYVQNFTDVDDKMIKRANEEGSTVEEIAHRYIEAYLEDMKCLHIKEEGMLRPKATEHIQEMIDMIQSLIDKGHAYEANGDVYFRVSTYHEEYGALSKQKIEDLQSGARIEVTELKESPLDFALWKASKPGEPHWDSPWGKGRPGWHIECSAMSNKYFGNSFDIHGGGQDLIFPHHENEIAQSKCSCGGSFAKYWMHNGYINIDGVKMSKSLGNFVLLRDILKHFSGKVIRFFMLSAHYRKPMNFSDTELNQAKIALERMENSLIRVHEISEHKIDPQGNSGEELKKVLKDTEEKFIEAMDEDFNTAQAIGVLFELVRELNKTLDSPYNQEGYEVLKKTATYLYHILYDVLGIAVEVETKVENLTVDLVEFILELRREARAEKNWELSDRIRDRLAELGIQIKDGKDSTTWRV